MDALSSTELKTVNAIRLEVPQPDANTIMEKVIPKEDIEKYISEKYQKPWGFMSTARDSKHLNTFDDIYHGMRLDYENTKFVLSDGSCGVIRFQATNSNTVVIPKSVTNGGVEISGSPFTGHGFTSGNNGRSGVPEWRVSFELDIQDEGNYGRFSLMGTEQLRAVWSYFSCEEWFTLWVKVAAPLTLPEN